MKAGAWVVLLTSLTVATALALTTPLAVAQQGDSSNAGATGAKVSVWSGVYTTAQSKRGEEVHDGLCVLCHGARLNGAGQPDLPPSPAIARATFLNKWAGQSVAALVTYVRTKMPPDNPGTLTAQDSVDAVAHMFAVSNIPAGAKELPSDPKALADIVIEAQPK